MTNCARYETPSHVVQLSRTSLARASSQGNAHLYEGTGAAVRSPARRCGAHQFASCLVRCIAVCITPNPAQARSSGRRSVHAGTAGQELHSSVHSPSFSPSYIPKIITKSASGSSRLSEICTSAAYMPTYLYLPCLLLLYPLCPFPRLSSFVSSLRRI